MANSLANGTALTLLERVLTPLRDEVRLTFAEIRRA
jgi:hypothetical protein